MTRVIRRPGQARHGVHGEGARAVPAPPRNHSADGWVMVWVDWLASPQGSHIGVRMGKRCGVKESNPRTEPYREAVAAACREHLGPAWVPLDGPLEAELFFHLAPPPASDPTREWPWTAPDLDKLVRATFDGITRGRLWHDDARCVRLVTEKMHAPTLEQTGVAIHVRRRTR